MANDELHGKLRALSFLLKYSHDLFDAQSFSDAAMDAINNSCALLNFTTSSLFMMSNGKAELVAQFGVPELNRHSRLAVAQKCFVESQNFSAEPTLFEENLPDEMRTNEMVYLIFSLVPPKRFIQVDFSFIWLIGYEKNIPPFAGNTAKLIANSMADALYFHRLVHDDRLRRLQHHVKKRWGWLAILVIVTAVMFLRISEKTNAEFTLKAPQTTAAYAWFDGPIAKCLKQDGEHVNKGEIIAEYETEQLQYRLNMAKSTLRETETELAIEEQDSFTDASKLGKVGLLKEKCRSLKIAVDEAQWYWEHAKLKAPASGLLALADGRAELLAGKAVRTGDKIFEIFSGDGVAAEILVNERDASVLHKDMTINLFLYNTPEEAIPVTIEEVSHYPELTEQRTYCYKIRVALPKDKANLRLGMRGIAKISGPKVSLGYYLFKSAVLYLRGM